MNFENFAETTAFRQVARTITALSTQDERIADEFRAIERGRISSGKIVEITGDVPVGMKLSLVILLTRFQHGFGIALAEQTGGILKMLAHSFVAST